MTPEESTPANQPSVPTQFEVHKLIVDNLQKIPHEIPKELLNNETFLHEVVNEVFLLLRRGQASEALDITEKYHLDEHQDLLHEDAIHTFAVLAANHLVGGGSEHQLDRQKLIRAFALQKDELA